MFITIKCKDLSYSWPEKLHGWSSLKLSFDIIWEAANLGLVKFIAEKDNHMRIPEDLPPDAKLDSQV